MVSSKVPVNNIFLWFLILLHLHVLLFKQNGTAKASKVSGCPFQIASHFLSRQSAFFTNSFLFRSPSTLFKLNASPDGFNTLFRSTKIAMMVCPENLVDEFPVDPETCCPLSTQSNIIPPTEFMKSNLEVLMPTVPANDPVEVPDAVPPLPPDETQSLEVVVIGLSHHNTKVDVREKLAIPEHLWNQASTELCEYPSITEASVLSTCNRFEIYISGPNQYEAIRDAVDYLVKRSGGHFDHATLKKNLFMLAGEDAIWHLLRVSAGLDSLVLGEGQILAQVKRCYEHGIADDVLMDAPAESLEAPKMVGGRAGKVVSRMLLSAVTAGKRVRSETGISKGAVSVSSAAAEFSKEKLWPDCRIAALKDAAITIVGAGKMTKLLLHHFLSAGITKVTIVNRSLGSISNLQTEFPGLTIVPKLMTEMYETIAVSDVVFTSTASEVPIVEGKTLMESLSSAKRNRGLQMIDISVPRNIHEDCNTVSPLVHCYSVDDLKQVVSKNTSKRKKEMVEAEHILKTELHKFRNWQQSRGVVPTIAKLREKAENLRVLELEKISNKLSSLSPKDFGAVEKATRSIVNKLIHGPMYHLKGLNPHGDGKDAIRQFQQAFELY